MEKNYIFWRKGLLILLFCLIQLVGFSQITESFESGITTSYTTATSYSLGSGTWTALASAVAAGTTGVKTGTYSCQLKSTTGAQITSPTITTGISTVTFWGAASTASGGLQVNYSTNGGSSWTPATGSPFTLTSTTPVQLTATINSSSSTILVQFYRTGATVYIDDISINPPVAKTTIANGAWTSNSTWSGGSVPAATDNVIIAHNVTVGGGTRNSGTTTTINAGANLIVSGTYTNSGTTTVNGSFQLEAGGWATGNNFVYGAAGALNFNATGSYTVNNTDVYWPTTNPPYNVNVLQGGLTLNSANRTIAGTLATAAGVTLTSSTLTLNGTCQINAGGYFANAPIYGSASTLKYNINGNYGRGPEWNSTTPAAAGYPYNVQLSNNTALDPGANSGTNMAWEIGGNLTIDNGSGFYLDFGSDDMNTAIKVLGDVNVNGGLSLSDNLNGDLKIGGNLNFLSGYSFNAKGRALIFTKNGTQIITASSTPTFHYIAFAPASGTSTVQLSGTDLNITAPNNGAVIDFGAAANVFDLNGRTLTLGTAGVANAIAGSLGAFKGSTTSNLSLLGTGNVGTLNFTLGSQNLGTLTLNRTASGAATLGTPLAINTALNLTSGLLTLGSNHLTLGGSATVGGTPSVTAMVVADGTGEFRKTFLANGSFTFPIGDASAPDGTQYSPATLNFTAGSYASAYAGLRVQDLKNTNIDATTDYISRNWVVSSSGITSPTYSFSGTYTAADISGTETNSTSGRWDGSTWTVGTACGSNTISVTGLTTLPATNEFCAGNPLKLAEINVKQGATSIATAGSYAFANTAIGVNTDVTFTVENLGIQNLTLGTAVLTGTGFSLLSNYTSPITGPTGTTTFTIRFTPTALGAFSGSISIPNNDVTGGENPYIINFSGTGIGSASSDIVFNAASAATGNTNLIYTTYQSASISNTGSGTNGSIGVMGITVRDGGSAGTDADASASELNALSFSVTNGGNIRSAALFNGNTLIQSVAVNGASTINFTGLSGANVTCADNSTLALNLRVTFLTSVTDNQKMVFTVASATANPATSTFAASNAGGASSDNNAGNDINRIEVVADRMVFLQQPSTTSTNAAMSPAVTIKAIDINSNLDLDFVGSMSVSSSGTMTGSPVAVSAVAGIATFSTLTHTAIGAGLALTASSTGFTNVVSSSFDVVDVAPGTYRSTGSGNWSSLTWERFVAGSGWTSTTAPTTGTTDSILIFNNVVFNTTGAWSLTKMVVKNGGTFTQNNTNGVTFTTLQVNGGGVYNMNYLTTINGTIELDDNATFNLNYKSNSLVTNLWNGTEKFHPNSNFVVQDINGTDVALVPDATSISAYTNAGYSALFGNIIVDFAAGGGYFTSSFQLLPIGFTGNLTHGNLIYKTSNNSTSRFCFGGSFGTAGSPVTIGGSIIMQSTYSNIVSMRNDMYNTYLYVKGDIINNSTAAFRMIAATSGSATISLNVDGNITLTNTGIFYFNASSSSTETITLNVKGDISVASTTFLANLSSTNSAILNFNGTGGDGINAATQTVSIASASSLSNRNQNLVANVLGGTYVQLQNSNWELGKNSSVTVANGATLDFGFTGSTALNITSVSGATGTAFSSAQNSTLKISSPAGIANTSGSVGNVQTTTAPSYNQTATFWYLGKSPSQVTGSGLTSSSNGKIVIAELASNAVTLTPSANISISNGTTLDALGGRLDIRKGTVVETSAATITGTGRLVMTDGIFQSNVTGVTLPALTNYGSYSLTGGTVELNANAGTQTLSGAPSSYYNVKFSGGNTLGTDEKNISSAIVINNNLSITGTAILNSASNGVTGNAGVTMDGGRWRISKTTNTQPELAASTSGQTYSLTGGTIEFYGTSATQSQSMRATFGSSSTPMNYFNLEANANAANVSAGGYNLVVSGSFSVSGAMNINSPACYQLGSTHTISGAGSFNVNAGSTFKYGGTIAASGASGNIQTATRNFSSTASYGFVGSYTPQIAGTGLPSSCVNLYVEKTNSGNLISLSNPLQVTNVVNFLTNGIVDATTNTLFVSTASTTAIQGHNTASASTNNYVRGKLRRAVSASANYFFPIGDASHEEQTAQINFTNLNGATWVEANYNSATATTSGTDKIVGCNLDAGATPNDTIKYQQLTGTWDLSSDVSTGVNYSITFAPAGANPFSNAANNMKHAGTYITQCTGTADNSLMTSNGHTTESGITHFSPFQIGSNPAILLPVKWLNIQAKSTSHKTIDVSWATAQEINNKGFAIERSENGIEFKEIGWVAGNGNTTEVKNYLFEDKNVLNNTMYYYRLQQVDFDGNIDFSSMVSASVNKENTFGLNIFPIPANNLLNLQLKGISKSTVNINIYNMLGELVKSQQQEIDNETTFPMDVSELANGNYTISVISNLNNINKKFTIVK